MVATIETPTEAPQVLREIQAGGGLSLSAVGRLFPAARGTGTTDPATVYRWCTAGSRGPDGERVRLEYVRVGCRLLTSRAAVERYVARLTGAAIAAPDPTPTRTRSASQTRRASERAGELLAARGA